MLFQSRTHLFSLRLSLLCLREKCFVRGRFHSKDTKTRTAPIPCRTRLSHISRISGGPSVLPPKCFPSRDQHANLQCGEKKTAAQQFTLFALLLPPTAIASPPSLASLFLLLFTDTAVLCQRVTSQAHLQNTPKHSHQRIEEGQENGFHMGFTPSPSPFLYLFLLFHWAEVDGHYGRTRR